MTMNIQVHPVQPKEIQENLVKLFLRLNGYFTTGLIIHSPTYGANKTQIDVLASRFPNHLQSDRPVKSCPFLQISEGFVDIIVGEVKSGKEPIQLNKPLWEDKTTIEKLINWLGICDEDHKNNIITEFMEKAKPKRINTSDSFNEITIKSKVGQFKVRQIVFSLDRNEPRKNQSRYVYGQVILEYIWQCLRSNNDTCSIVYDTEAWGTELQPIVDYFKDETKHQVGTIKDYYQKFLGKAL